MDPVIHSQIKSPLVRTLQSIPTNSSNFIHGIPDNTPPFSKRSIKVQNSSGDVNGTTRVFKIPQQGHLNRVYLRCRVYGHLLTRNFDTIETDSDNVLGFSHVIEEIQLRSHNSIIQTIPGSVIPFEVASLCRSEQSLKHNLMALAGYQGASLDGSHKLEVPFMNKTLFLPANPGLYLHTLPDGVVRDYLILVPLSSTFYLKDNLQTRMMEDLELVVKIQKSPIQINEGAMGNVVSQNLGYEKDVTELEATFDFINFHENVEEVIRNENFKPDIPAALLQSDYTSFVAQFKSSRNVGEEGFEATYECALNSDALVTDIFAVPRIRSDTGIYTRNSPLRNVGIHFQLMSGNDVILEGDKNEYDGVESIQYSTVVRHGQNAGVLPQRWAASGTRIRTALNNTDEYFDGGISFQSLIEPKLIIRVTSDVEAEDYFPLDENVPALDGGGIRRGLLHTHASSVSFNVVLKRKVMLRIDGNTGKISKSLES